MEQAVDKLILDNFNASVDFVKEFFGITSALELSSFVKVIAALRMLPRDAMQDVIKPIMDGQCEALGINPKVDLDIAADCADVFALAIQDATAVLIRAMERQEYNAQRLLSGQGGLIT